MSSKKDQIEELYAEAAAYLFSKNEHIAHIPSVEIFNIDGTHYGVFQFITGSPAFNRIPLIEISAESFSKTILMRKFFMFDFIVAHGDISFAHNIIEDPNAEIWVIDNEGAFLPFVAQGIEDKMANRKQS
ncbi:MAG: hypothetical protein R3A45_03440 [Bdellovibrionota bacterium]